MRSLAFSVVILTPTTAAFGQQWEFRRSRWPSF
jgi:hypothetical protein